MSFFKYVLFLMLITGDSICDNLNFAVIVSKNTEITSISKKDISNIFLSKTKKLPNGERAIPIGLQTKEEEKSFYLKLSGKTPIQLRKYWATMIFTGKGQAPKKIQNIEKIISFVQKNKNAIAYLPLQEAKKYDVQIVMEL